METTQNLYSSRFTLCKTLRNISVVACLILILFDPSSLPAQAMKKVPLPFSPIGINCLPWFVAKEARIYEKNGINGSCFHRCILGSDSVDAVRGSGYGRVGRTVDHFQCFAGWEYHPCNSHGSAVHPVNHG